MLLMIMCNGEQNRMKTTPTRAKPCALGKLVNEEEENEDEENQRREIRSQVKLLIAMYSSYSVHVYMSGREQICLCLSAILWQKEKKKKVKFQLLHPVS